MCACVSDTEVTVNNDSINHTDGGRLLCGQVPVFWKVPGSWDRAETGVPSRTHKPHKNARVNTHTRVDTNGIKKIRFSCESEGERNNNDLIFSFNLVFNLKIKLLNKH